MGEALLVHGHPGPTADLGLPRTGVHSRPGPRLGPSPLHRPRRPTAPWGPPWGGRRLGPTAVVGQGGRSCERGGGRSIRAPVYPGPTSTEAHVHPWPTGAWGTSWGGLGPLSAQGRPTVRLGPMCAEGPPWGRPGGRLGTPWGTGLPRCGEGGLFCEKRDCWRVVPTDAPGPPLSTPWGSPCSGFVRSALKLLCAPGAHRRLGDAPRGPGGRPGPPACPRPPHGRPQARLRHTPPCTPWDRLGRATRRPLGTPHGRPWGHPRQGCKTLCPRRPLGVDPLQPPWVYTGRLPARAPPWTLRGREKVLQRGGGESFAGVSQGGKNPWSHPGATLESPWASRRPGPPGGRRPTTELGPP